MRIFIFILLSLPLLAQSLKRDITEYFTRLYPDCKQVEVIFTDLPKNYESIELDKESSPILGKGSAIIPVYIKRNSKLNKWYINIKLNLYYEALVANRVIKKNEILDSTYFDKKIINFNSENGKLWTSKHPLNSKRSTSLIGKGEILKEECVEQIPTINAGDKILAEVNLNHVVVTADAVARQHGTEGEIIQIVCNNRIFKAKVIDSKKVQVE
ncbi:MAG: flagellar basal body P-ring formation protein FlgA [Ignavibacteriaceae bacterium]|nr:flagellar basal body P-ring formation protein FlgA [Ignavibacteriaceae bacterium]